MPYSPLVGSDDGNSALEVAGVSVRFGGLSALDDVSLSVRPGEIVGLIGPNGAGKTTLFNVICGFVRPDAGSISISGRSSRRVRPHQLTRLGVARTLQGVGLWPHLTIAGNVMTALHNESKGDLISAMLGLPRSSRDEQRLHQRAIDALGRLDIAEFAERLPTMLPYPVQKLASLARALVTHPDLLLLDEPASGLSEADIEKLGDLVRGLRSEMAVLVVEHHMDFVMGLCDRIVVLDFGKVIATGSPDEVRADPAVAKAYLGEEVAT
ncbi:MAG TPA: ABC transporter ATP-binding protein [Acidimicrobiales bacterium]|nr:ABC transporter ATP-binding protein [Acidimicrobiales bacterium]